MLLSHTTKHKKIKLISWHVDFVRVDLVAIDLVRVDLMTLSLINKILWSWLSYSRDLSLLSPFLTPSSRKGLGTKLNYYLALTHFLGSRDKTDCTVSSVLT